MAPKKKTTPKKAAAKPTQEVAQQAPQVKRPVGVKIFAFLIVAGLGVSALIGLGVIQPPVHGVEIKVLGQQAYENQPRTPLVARSDRDDKITETAITLLEAPEAAETPEEPQKIEVKLGLQDGDTVKTASLHAELEALKTTVEAQQQMLRMITQQQGEQLKNQQVQMQKLSVAVTSLQKQIIATDISNIEEHIQRLYLLQAIDRLYAQWENGVLLPETVQGWSKLAAAAGFKDAEQLALALASLLKEHGLLNEKEVIRAALAIQPTKKPTPKAEEAGFWAYLKAKFEGLISIEKVDTKTPKLREDLVATLKAGDIPAFWQTLALLDGAEDSSMIKGMRDVVENHTSQKFAFDSLYQAVVGKAGEPKPVKDVNLNTEEVQKP